MVACDRSSILFDGPDNSGCKSCVPDDLNVALFKPQERRSRQSKSSHFDNRVGAGRHSDLVLFSLGVVGNLDCLRFAWTGGKTVVTFETAEGWSGTPRFGTRHKTNYRATNLRH